jgi:hypothetical protein
MTMMIMMITIRTTNSATYQKTVIFRATVTRGSNLNKKLCEKLIAYIPLIRH